MTVDSTANLVGREESPEYDWSDYYWTAQPQSPSKDQKGMFYGWKKVVLGSWLNLLLVLLPVAWVLGVTMKSSHDLVFAFCTLALIPLVKLHDLSTRDLALRVGGSKTGLINATLSNIVEIVLAISALRKCELRIVQSALIGSILSKLLLILGLCFFAGGMRFSEQGFDATATQIHSSLLNISVGAVLIPVAYHFTLGNASDQTAEQAQDILHMSHGVSIVLLIIYAAYLVFQLWSHPHLYHDNHNKKSNPLSVKLPMHLETRIAKRQEQRQKDALNRMNGEKATCDESPPFNLSFPQRPYISPQALASDVTLSNPDPDFNAWNPTVRLVGEGGNATRARARVHSTVESEPGSRSATPATAPATVIKQPQLSWQLTLILLVVVTAAVAVTADWLVGSLDGVSMRISKAWVGLILLPVASSVAECITAVNVSVKDQLTLSVSVAVGSALQTALFVIPFSVILGWITNKPLSLLMDPFQSLVLYLSVQTAGYVLADGKSNWLEGMMLICLYIIVAVSFWFYPGSEMPDMLTSCNA